MQETERHTEAFEFYYYLGDARSYPQVSRKFGVSKTSIKKWAKAFEWSKRIKLKDIESANKESERLANLKHQQDVAALTPKEAYRKDIENTLKIIKASILSAVDPTTKKLVVKAETPTDINSLIAAYEKLAKLDLLLSENDPPVVEVATPVHVPDKKKRKLGAGRKTKLTPVLQEKLLKAVRGNMTISRASLLCGITPETYWRWCRVGEAERKRIIDGVETSQREAIKAGKLDRLDLEAEEAFITNKIRKLNPNKYFYFFIEVKKAEADAELSNLKAISRARDGGEYVSEIHIERNVKGKIVGKREVKKYLQPQWYAAAWLLERKYPQLYGKHVTYDGALDHKLSAAGNGGNSKELKDEMQSKKRVAELALTLIRLASKENTQKAIEMQTDI
ncbi:hypothetical protein KAR91_74920 [Candidatus Pacearchaeota archaeon]|nr:hypothetical protein [Candidatus Pacearchaeota archaeon]